MTVPNPLIAWGVRFSEVSYNLRFTYNSVSETLRFPVTGTDLDPTQDYYVIGDGTAQDLLGLLEATLESHSSGPLMTVSLTSAFLVRVTHLSIGFNLVWDDAATTLDKAIFGFSATTGASNDVTGDLGPQTIWRPERPEMNGRGDRRTVIAGGVVTGSGAQRTSFFGAGPDQRDWRFELLDPSKVLDNSAPSADPFGTVEAAWRLSMARGHEFRFYEDETDLATNAYTAYRANPVSGQVWEPDPQYPSGLYAADLAGRKV